MYKRILKRAMSAALTLVLVVSSANWMGVTKVNAYKADSIINEDKIAVTGYETGMTTTYENAIDKILNQNDQVVRVGNCSSFLLENL